MGWSGLTFCSEAAAMADSGRLPCSDFHTVARAGRVPMREPAQRLPAHSPSVSGRCFYCDFAVGPPRRQSRRAPTPTSIRRLLPACWHLGRSAVPHQGAPLQPCKPGRCTPLLAHPEQNRRPCSAAWYCQSPLLPVPEISMEWTRPASISAASQGGAGRGVNRVSLGGRASMNAVGWRRAGRPPTRRADLL